MDREAVRWRLKACPRCVKGDMFSELNDGEEKWVCLQCGYNSGEAGKRGKSNGKKDE